MDDRTGRKGSLASLYCTPSYCSSMLSERLASVGPLCLSLRASIGVSVARCATLILAPFSRRQSPHFSSDIAPVVLRLVSWSASWARSASKATDWGHGRPTPLSPVRLACCSWRRSGGPAASPPIACGGVHRGDLGRRDGDRQWGPLRRAAGGLAGRIQAEGPPSMRARRSGTWPRVERPIERAAHLAVRAHLSAREHRRQGMQVVPVDPMWCSCQRCGGSDAAHRILGCRPCTVVPQRCREREESCK